MKKEQAIVFRAAFAVWQKRAPVQHAHPREEMLASFADGRLSEKEWRRVTGHLLHCRLCSEVVTVTARSGNAWQLLIMAVYPLCRLLHERAGPFMVRVFAARPQAIPARRILIRKKILQPDVS